MLKPTPLLSANKNKSYEHRRVHNTIRSHRLVRLASEQGKGGDMIEQIFRGYFEEGRNIADVDVLLDLAKKVCVCAYVRKKISLLFVVFRAHCRSLSFLVWSEGTTVQVVAQLTVG